MTRDTIINIVFRSDHGPWNLARQRCVEVPAHRLDLDILDPVKMMPAILHRAAQCATEYVTGDWSVSHITLMDGSPVTEMCDPCPCGRCWKCAKLREPATRHPLIPSIA